MAQLHRRHPTTDSWSNNWPSSRGPSRRSDGSCAHCVRSARKTIRAYAVRCATQGPELVLSLPSDPSFLDHHVFFRRCFRGRQNRAKSNRGSYTSRTESSEGLQLLYRLFHPLRTHDRGVAASERCAATFRPLSGQILGQDTEKDVQAIHAAWWSRMGIFVS